MLSGPNLPRAWHKALAPVARALSMCEWYSMPCSTRIAPAVSGAICPTSSRPKAPSGTIFKNGSTMAPGCTSTIWSVKKCVKHSNVSVNHRLRSLIARASRPPKQAAIGGLTREKNLQGRKRQLIVDTNGLVLRVLVHAADISDSEGGEWLL